MGFLLGGCCIWLLTTNLISNASTVYRKIIKFSRAIAVFFLYLSSFLIRDLIQSNLLITIIGIIAIFYLFLSPTLDIQYVPCASRHGLDNSTRGPSSPSSSSSSASPSMSLPTVSSSSTSFSPSSPSTWCPWSPSTTLYIPKILFPFLEPLCLHQSMHPPCLHRLLLLLLPLQHVPGRDLCSHDHLYALHCSLHTVSFPVQEARIPRSLGHSWCEATKERRAGAQWTECRKRKNGIIILSVVCILVEPFFCFDCCVKNKTNWKTNDRKTLMQF